MPSKFRLRRLFKKRLIVNSLAKLFHKLNFTPNMVTDLMLICSIISGFMLFYTGNLLIFSILVFIITLLDGVDGTLARNYNLKTQFGGIWDSVLDRLSEGVIFLSLYLSFFKIVDLQSINPTSSTDVNLVILLFQISKESLVFSYIASFIISYSRARASNEFKGDYDVGLLGRSERLMLLFVIGIVGYFYLPGFALGLLIFLLGVSCTATYRFLKIRKYIKKIELKTDDNTKN